MFLHSFSHSHTHIHPFSSSFSFSLSLPLILSFSLLFSSFPLFYFFLEIRSNIFTWLDFFPKKIHVYAHVRGIRQTKRTLLGGRMDHVWYVTAVIKIARYIWGRLAFLRFIYFFFFNSFILFISWILFFPHIFFFSFFFLHIMLTAFFFLFLFIF